MNNRELEYELTEQEQLNKVKYTKGFYAVFALCVCAIGIAGWYTYADVKNYMHHNESPEISITASEPVNEQAEVKLSGIEKNTTENEDVSDNAEEEVPQETPTVISEPVRSQRVCPTGENKKILSEYSMNNMVYFETLKDWRLHKGTDYAAAQGEEVFSISDGIVSAVRNFKRNRLAVPVADKFTARLRLAFRTIALGSKRRTALTAKLRHHLSLLIKVLYRTRYKTEHR